MGMAINKNSGIKMSSTDFRRNIESIKGTFAIESMNISYETIDNLRRISNGESTCSEIIEEIKEKYILEAY